MQAAPRLGLASLRCRLPTAPVFREGNLPLSASRLSAEKGLPLPFCSAQKGRASEALSKSGDFFFFFRFDPLFLHFLLRNIKLHLIPSPHPYLPSTEHV